MSAKSNAALTTENNAVITGQTAPESITPVTAGGLFQDMIDSMWNKTDDLLTLPPINVTKSQLSTLIAGSLINDQRQYTITDRSDGYKLIVFGRGTNDIQPIGIWMKGGTPKPIAVFMDYKNGYEGETNPFNAFVDENRKFNFTNQLIIADGTQGNGYSLMGDGNGKTKWMPPGNVFQNASVFSPGGTTGSEIMAGISASVVIVKSGQLAFNVTGEFTSADTSGDTFFTLRGGTGSAPANGAAPTGGVLCVFKRRTEDASVRKSFMLHFEVYSMLTLGASLGDTVWLDFSIKNNAGSAVDIFNIASSIKES